MDQIRHAMLIDETHDERARDAFIASLREYTMSELYPQLRRHYDEVLAPRYAAQHGEPPRSVDQVRTVMEDSQLYTGYSLLVRGTQELLWDTVGEAVERQLPTLIERAADALKGVMIYTEKVAPKSNDKPAAN